MFFSALHGVKRQGILAFHVFHLPSTAAWGLFRTCALDPRYREVRGKIRWMASLLVVHRRGLAGECEFGDPRSALGGQLRKRQERVS